MKRFTPPFLQKIDHYLVVNQPHIWATQIHKLLFWVSVYTFGAIAFSFCYPVNVHHIIDEMQTLEFASIPPVLMFLYWLYHISLHKVSAQFGEVNAWYSFQELFLYALGIGALVVSPILLSVTMDRRNAAIVSDTTLVEDINNLNQGRIYFGESPGIIEKGLWKSYREDDKTTFINNYSYFQHNIGLVDSLPILTREENAQIIWEAKFSDAKRLEAIQHFLNSFNRYAIKPMNYQPETVLRGAFPLARKDIKDNNDPIPVQIKVDEREMQRIYKVMKYIIFAKKKNSPLHDRSLYFSGSYGLCLFLLLLVVFYTLGLRYFMGLILVSTLSFALHLCFIYMSEAALGLIYFIEWAWVYALTKSIRKTSQTKILWSYFIIISPFAPFAFSNVIGMNHLFISSTPALLLSGIALAYSIWVLIGRNQLLHSLAMPKE